VGLQAILDAIHASGEHQVREVATHAGVQVQETLKEAQIEAERLHEEHRAAAAAPAAGERARIHHRARLEALQIVGTAREELVAAALCRTRERLGSMRMHPDYPAALQRLTEEALSEFNCSPQEISNTRLAVDPRDRELLGSILTHMGLDLQVSYELDCWGGIVATSEDGRVVVINTLEARLEKSSSYLRHYLAALFEDAAKDHRRRDPVEDVQ